MEVIAKVLGGNARSIRGASTVAEVRTQMGLDNTYAATVNGQSAEPGQRLQDGDYISFTKDVKAG